MEKREILPISIIVLMFIVGITLYPSMPDRMPIHWNTKGEIDSYGPKFVGLLIMPLVVAFMYWAFLFIPKVMVYKDNFRKFEKYYHGFKIIMISFLASLYIITLLINFGIKLNITMFMIIVLAILFYYIGHIMQFFKRNFFIGIRTPWTLSNEKVWNKTHKLASILFRVSAVLMLAALLKPIWFVWYLLIILITTIVVIIIYSYKQFQKLGGKIDKK